MLNYVKLTVLSENRVSDPNLQAEQGLAILVETEHDAILFDTGQTDVLLHNARTLNIDLSRVNKIVLSHGHYDHTGGLPYFMNAINGADIYCHPSLMNKKFRIYPAGRLDIGVPWEKHDLVNKGAHFIYKTHAHEIIPDFWFSGEIPRNTDYEKIDETYRQRVLESYIHDEIHDDVCLILNTARGLVVLLGCGHAGPVNSLKHAMRITNRKDIHLFAGGMHLQHSPDDRIEKIVRNLERINPEILAPLHCTGFRAINALYHTFRERVHFFQVGDSIEIKGSDA